MVLAVHSSTKILGLTAVAAVAALGLVSILYNRYRGNVVVQQETPSLDKGRFSFMANIPLIGWAYNYFNPTNSIKLAKVKPDPVSIGSPNLPFSSVKDLTECLETLKKTCQNVDTLILYGNKLFLIQDPGILAFNLTKMILVGVQINMCFADDSLDQLMVKNGWHPHEVDGVNIIEVASVDEAIKAVPEINPETSKPYPTVYSVKT
jgi:hypothetical protein